MVKAWYIDDDQNNPSLEHHKQPPEFVSTAELYKKTGVEYFRLNVETFETDGVLDKMKVERGYSYEDELVCTRGSPDCEEKLKRFFTEHLHDEDEIRFITEGAGFFDVRDGEERWLRVAVLAGDLLVLPSGIYHRFTLDVQGHIKMKRLFVCRAEWRAFDRPAGALACRRQYEEALKRGFTTTAH